jgi:hypothetical protein
MRPYAKEIWHSSFAAIEGPFPPCPDDLNEPQWANLMFSNHCHVSGPLWCAHELSHNPVRLLGMRDRTKWSGWYFIHVYGGAHATLREMQPQEVSLSPPCGETMNLNLGALSPVF